MTKLQTAKITEAADELTIAQVGPTDNRCNPLTTVFAFVKLAADDKIDDAQFHWLLIEQASGWERTESDSIAIIREMLRSSNFALHVWYPTPRIAYARVLEALPDGETPERMHIITLVWRNERGWRLFGVGPYLPWEIPFGLGELDTDPLDGRE